VYDHPEQPLVAFDVGPAFPHRRNGEVAVGKMVSHPWQAHPRYFPRTPPLVRSSPSLALRAAAAVLLMVGFYVLALGIAGSLIAIPVAEITYAHRLDFRIAAFCIVGGLAILRAIVPRPDRFEPPGPVLTAQEHPRLFEKIEEVSAATSQAMPADVYLVPEVNAWVAQRGGILGFGSRRVMGLGLPLLEMLSVDELRAVLAHEFGHYHGGDTALGPWIHRTRAAIGRTLDSLARHSSLLMKPFNWYGLGFLRITHGISRSQEYAADALAARVVGATPLATGLQKIHGAAEAFVPYWHTEIAPILERGYRPPIAAGFTTFLASPEVSSHIASSVAQALAGEKLDPYDTHPPLRERLAAISSRSAPVANDESPRAASLLEDVDAVEARLVAHLSTSERAMSLDPITWPDAGPRVWGAIWRERVKNDSRRLAGITPAQIPRLAADLEASAVDLGFAPNRQAAQESDGKRDVVHLLGSACAVALIDRGWSLSALPGEDVVLSRGELSIAPFANIQSLASGKLSAVDWEASWRTVSLLDLDLGAAAGVENQGPMDR
jgi:Zn-dependent protease with chaperone function